MSKVVAGQTPLTDANAGIIQSLLIKAQRATLDAIGQRLSTPVVYLKAAWADPVLYGGRGERTGTDIDVLVRPDRFEAFAADLRQQGYRRPQPRSGIYEGYFGHKEWTFEAPAGGLAVDLHRALTQPIWFDLDAEELIARSIAWPSVDGPLLSLAAEDQILYAAVHHANHLYEMDDRHFEDCRRLLALQAVDWELIAARAGRAQLRLALLLLVEALRAAGHAIPPLPGEGRPGPLALRRKLVGHFVRTSPRLELRRPRSRALDYLVLRPLLSDRPTALPRIAVRYGVPWLRERLARARPPNR